MLKLKEYRKISNLTQIHVAGYLGITQGQYSCLESGRSLLNAQQIIDLCNLFKCTPNDLLGFRGVHTLVASFLDDVKSTAKE